ncbi:hypothetical protein ACVBEJ_03865 [Porticoccus sp. GXU_MW_L64]
MKTLSAVATCALALAATPVQAGKNANLKLDQGVYKMAAKDPAYGPRVPINGPVIKVYVESGTTYSHVANTHKKLTFLTKYTASCSGKRKVSGVSVKLAGETASGSDKGGGFETGYAQIKVPYGGIAGLAPASWCNHHLKTLSLEHNRSKKDIVKKGFTLYMPDVAEAQGTVFCSHNILKGAVDGDSAKLGVWVYCAANPNVDRPKPGTSTRPGKPDVGETRHIFKSATLTAVDTTLVGKSPQRLQLVGNITAAGAGTIKAQLVGSGGFESPVRTFIFDKAGSQQMRFSHYVRQQDPGKTLSSAAGSGDASKKKGWVVMKVWYEVRNNIAKAQKQYTTPKLNYSVNFNPEPKRMQFKKAE